MRVYIANTDVNWYRHLSVLAFQSGGLDEVNFWRPSGKQVVGYLGFGDPFVFKLKKAHGHAVVGFGLWVAFARPSCRRPGAPSVRKTGRRRWKPYGSASRNEPSITNLWRCWAFLLALICQSLTVVAIGAWSPQQYHLSGSYDTGSSKPVEVYSIR